MHWEQQRHQKTVQIWFKMVPVNPWSAERTLTTAPSSSWTSLWTRMTCFCYALFGLNTQSSSRSLNIQQEKWCIAWTKRSMSGDAIINFSQLLIFSTWFAWNSGRSTDNLKVFIIPNYFLYNLLSTFTPGDICWPNAISCFSMLLLSTIRFWSTSYAWSKHFFGLIFTL